MSKRVKFLVFVVILVGAVRITLFIFVPYKLITGGYINDKFFYFLRSDTSTYSTSYRDIKIFTYPEHNMFPDAWWESPVSGKVSPLLERDKERAVRILKIALDKYSKNVLDENLRKVYLLGDLNFYGVAYGGTYYDKSVFMVIKSDLEGYTDAYVEKTFHHEFSSILFYKYKSDFDEEHWVGANALEFKYGNGGLEAIKSGNTSLKFDEQCNKLGLLNEYSKASVEEDFNEMEGNLFLSSKEFWEVVDKYDRIKKKIKLMIEFYNKIDPMFTEEYFRGLTGE